MTSKISAAFPLLKNFNSQIGIEGNSFFILFHGHIIFLLPQFVIFTVDLLHSNIFYNLHVVSSNNILGFQSDIHNNFQERQIWWTRRTAPGCCIGQTSSQDWAGC